MFVRSPFCLPDAWTQRTSTLNCHPSDTTKCKPVSYVNGLRSGRCAAGALAGSGALSSFQQMAAAYLRSAHALPDGRFGRIYGAMHPFPASGKPFFSVLTLPARYPEKDAIPIIESTLKSVFSPQRRGGAEFRKVIYY